MPFCPISPESDWGSYVGRNGCTTKFDSIHWSFITAARIFFHPEPCCTGIWSSRAILSYSPASPAGAWWWLNCGWVKNRIDAISGASATWWVKNFWKCFGKRSGCRKFLISISLFTRNTMRNAVSTSSNEIFYSQITLKTFFFLLNISRDRVRFKWGRLSAFYIAEPSGKPPTRTTLKERWRYRHFETTEKKC